jgi:uncharacterized protein (TIGR01319 family)
MDIALLVDFGSTHTKVLAVDLEDETIIGRSQAVTTVNEGITLGLNRALEQLFSVSGIKESDINQKFASSSAAGGLRMAAIGLVPALTLEAATQAALGAGAKVVWSSGYELDEEKMSEIEAANCDIILLSGGTDGGDKKVITHNAKILSTSGIEAPILVAGNRTAAGDVKKALNGSGKNFVFTENVLPSLETLNIEPVQNLIRDVFINKIIKAKGLNKAQDYIGDIVMPTPKATMEAASLLADGTEDEAGIGSLLVVEVGGATINIHSVDAGNPIDPHTVMRGLPEPRVKRTVEGDLGIRYNAPTIIEFLGAQPCLKKLNTLIPDAQFDSEALIALSHDLSTNVGFVPKSNQGDCIDLVLAESAVAFAVKRHCGTLRHEFSLAGEIKVQKGKDLTRVKNIIGTGGIFKYGRWPEKILGAALFNQGEPWSLKPIAPKAYIDSEYLLYGMGLLAERYPAKALRIAKKYLKPVSLC